ncbi:hypothetical protein ACM66B_006317 [Microbotryomycetes sp. NB124-2]
MATTKKRKATIKANPHLAKSKQQSKRNTRSKPTMTKSKTETKSNKRKRSQRDQDTSEDEDSDQETEHSNGGTNSESDSDASVQIQEPVKKKTRNKQTKNHKKQRVPRDYSLDEDEDAPIRKPSKLEMPPTQTRKATFVKYVERALEVIDDKTKQLPLPGKDSAKTAIEMAWAYLDEKEKGAADWYHLRSLFDVFWSDSAMTKIKVNPDDLFGGRSGVSVLVRVVRSVCKTQKLDLQDLKSISQWLYSISEQMDNKVRDDKSSPHKQLRSPAMSGASDRDEDDEGQTSSGGSNVKQTQKGGKIGCRGQAKNVDGDVDELGSEDDRARAAAVQTKTKQRVQKGVEKRDETKKTKATKASKKQPAKTRQEPQDEDEEDELTSGDEGGNVSKPEERSKQTDNKGKKRAPTPSPVKKTSKKVAKRVEKPPPPARRRSSSSPLPTSPPAGAPTFSSVNKVAGADEEDDDDRGVRNYLLVQGGDDSQDIEVDIPQDQPQQEEEVPFVPPRRRVQDDMHDDDIPVGEVGLLEIEKGAVVFAPSVHRHLAGVAWPSMIIDDDVLPDRVLVVSIPDGDENEVARDDIQPFDHEAHLPDEVTLHEDKKKFQQALALCIDGGALQEWNRQRQVIVSEA